MCLFRLDLCIYMWYFFVCVLLLIHFLLGISFLLDITVYERRVWERKEDGEKEKKNCKRSKQNGKASTFWSSSLIKIQLKWICVHRYDCDVVLTFVVANDPVLTIKGCADEIVIPYSVYNTHLWRFDNKRLLFVHSMWTYISQTDYYF